MPDMQFEAGRMIRTGSFFEVFAPIGASDQPDCVEIGGAI
jgi:hypothetical protein